MCEAWLRNAQYEGSYVKVCTTETKPLVGYMYVCDPETGNIGLLSRGPTVHLVFSSDVTSISTVGKLPNDIPKTLPAQDEKKSDALGSQAVLDGLLKRRITAEMKDDGGQGYIDVFGGIATVRPPFDIDSCRSTNENVLLQVKRVLAEISASHKQNRN